MSPAPSAFPLHSPGKGLTAPEPTSHPVVNPKVAIIIDDVGLETKAADDLLNVPAHLTWSVLPYAPHARKYAEAGRERGFEVLMHLPLETIKGKVNPGQGVIKRSWKPERMLAQLEQDLLRVPEAVGINNHMGTTGPNDQVLADLLMRELKRRNLFYVDSVTDRSIAIYFARKYEVTYAKRDVFIDHYKELEPNEQSLRALLKIALKNGQAIGIGHARPGTAREIMDLLPEFERAGVKIVPASELVKVPGTTPRPTPTASPGVSASPRALQGLLLSPTHPPAAVKMNTIH